MKTEKLPKSEVLKNLNGELTLSGIFYTTYLVLELSFPESPASNYNRVFFIKGGISKIIFSDSKLHANPLKNKCISINAIDVNETSVYKRLTFYTRKEVQNVTDFVRTDYSKVLQNESYNSDSIFAILNDKIQIFQNRELAFIRRNGDSFYCLWLFRNGYLTGLKDTSALALLDIYNKTFTERLKKSADAALIVEQLTGYLQTKKGFIAPTFSTLDKNGDSVSLSKYKGQYVLLQFWASWCSPCLEEIPLLKKIEENFASRNLKMIGISRDSDSTKFNNAIIKYKMTWTQVLESQLINQIYGNKPIPTLYLINPEGRIIFSSNEDTFQTLEDLLSKSII